MPSGLCIAVCENLGREAAAVIKEYEGVYLATYPANCGQPPMSWEDLEQAVTAGWDGYRRIDLLGSSCIAEMGAPPKGWDHCRRHLLKWCFSPLLNQGIIAEYIREGAYLVTPGWLRHWPKHIEKWGFDQVSARSFFGESAARLVLLDTGMDDTSPRILQEFADFVALPRQVIPIGLDFLQLTLSKIILEWKREEDRHSAEAAVAKERRQLADYAMIFDLVDSLARVNIEKQVVESICHLFSMLCAPACLHYRAMIEGRPGEIQSFTSDQTVPELLEVRLNDLQGDYSWTSSGKGFLLRISDPQETLGILEVDGIAFPEYKEHYLNLALTITKVFALAIRNARAYEKLEKTLHDLQAAQSSLKILRGLIPICSSCKKIRDDQGFWNQIEAYIRDHSEAEFTHGICPECIKKLYPDFS